MIRGVGRCKRRGPRFRMYAERTPIEIAGQVPTRAGRGFRSLSTRVIPTTFGVVRVFWVLAATIALTCALAETASAARPATEEEAALILDLAGLPPQCAAISVSTANDRWASLTGTHADGCPLGDGYIVYRYLYGGWEEVFQGSDGQENCKRVDMPTAAGDDLGVCLPPTKRKFVLNYLKERLVFKPRLLPNGAHSFYGELRWRNWGSNYAKGRGVLDYADAYAVFRVPVTVTLRGEIFCGLKRAYKRMITSEVRYNGRIAFPRESRRLECPYNHRLSQSTRLARWRSRLPSRSVLTRSTAARGRRTSSRSPSTTLPDCKWIGKKIACPDW